MITGYGDYVVDLYNEQLESDAEYNAWLDSLDLPDFEEQILLDKQEAGNDRETV